MFRADFQKKFTVLFPVKALHRVGAMESERMRLGQLIPQSLELKGGIKLSLRPQDSYHLSKCGNLATAGLGHLSRSFNISADYVSKGDRVRHAARHKPG